MFDKNAVVAGIGKVTWIVVLKVPHEDLESCIVPC